MLRFPRCVALLLAAFALLLLPSSSAFRVGVASPGVSLSPSSYTSRLRPSSTFLSSSSSSSPAHGVPSRPVVGIVGPTGAVGKEIIGVLEKRGFPLSKLRLFGSDRSAGGSVATKFGAVSIEKFDQSAAKECDIVFLAVSGEFALEHAEKLAEKCVVIDNSSAFRYKKHVPLIVPEINGRLSKTARLIANPNCTTAIGLMAVAPLHRLFGAKRIIMSTYQAASGAGQEGMDELKKGTHDVSTGAKAVADNKVFAYPLPFNLIPQIDKFQENGYTKEEMKVTWETRKILDLPDDFPVSCTAVRIPILRAHSEAISIEFERKVNVSAAMEALRAAPGVELVDDVKATPARYPMPMTATSKYDVEVGRVRRSEAFGDYGLDIFVSGDQLLRGAALNAVIIAEQVIAK